MKAIEVKKQLVEEIKENFQNSASVIFVDYKGISVAEDTKLRKECTDNGVTYKVYKNRFLNIIHKKRCLNIFDQIGNSPIAGGTANHVGYLLDLVKCIHGTRRNVRLQ